MASDLSFILKTPQALTLLLGIGGFGIILGYYLGRPTPSRTSKSPNKKSWPNSYDVTVHRGSSDEEAEGQDEDEDEDSEEGDGKELKDFSNIREEVKLVLVVRTDLGMGKGLGHFPIFRLCLVLLLQCCTDISLSQ